MKSKEEKMLELFFESSSRHWHFEEILKKAKISRPQAMNWLRKLAKEKIIMRIKKKGKMPYYTGNFESPSYQNKKKLFALNNFYQTGFLNHLAELKKAETVILFGSFAKADWHEKSDIDVFILGDAEELDSAKYEKKLGRAIQSFVCRNKEELKKLSPELLRNILRGNVIKGYTPKEVFVNAAL